MHILPSLTVPREKGFIMEQRNISRRGFVKMAGLAASAAAMLSMPVLAEADEVTWDYQADVVVLGYGAAGAAGAIEAADNGASVIILEKAPLPGGSMARCGGAIMGANTNVQRALGVEDSADALYNWVMTCTDGMCPEDIARTFADNAGANVDWLEQLNSEYVGTQLFEYEWAQGGEEEFGTERSGSSGGAGCLDATGCDYEKFGITEAEAVPRTHWATAAPDKTCNSGPELFLPLYSKINATSDLITPIFNTAFRQFVFNGVGEVIGVIAENTEGNLIKVGANKGVLLATGGFCASFDMKKRFCSGGMNRKSYMSDTCEGDGIKAAMAIGADLAQMDLYYPIDKKQVYTYNVQYNDVFYHWDMDEDGWMEVPEFNMSECHGGVAINTDAQVMDVWGAVIPRLYASGNDTGTNIFGVPGNYPGCGSYVAFAICYGRIAGANIAALEPVA